MTFTKKELKQNIIPTIGSPLTVDFLNSVSVATGTSFISSENILDNMRVEKYIPLDLPEIRSKKDFVKFMERL